MFVPRESAILICRNARTKNLQFNPWIEYIGEEIKREVRNLYVDEEPVLRFKKVTRGQGYLEGKIFVAEENGKRVYYITVNFVNDPPYQVKEHGSLVLNEDELFEYLKDAAIEIIP